MNHTPRPIDPALFTDQLKNNTGLLHRQLEATPLSAAIVSADVSLHVYCLYLSLMRQVHESIERQVFPLLEGIVPDLQHRRKARLADNDLKALGSEPEPSRLWQDVFMDRLSIPQALGILYVIEGSGLGARYILKNMARLPVTAGKTTYFNGYGEQTGSRWKSLLEVINRYESVKQCGNAITEGASLFYEKLIGLFDGTSPA